MEPASTEDLQQVVSRQGTLLQELTVGLIDLTASLKELWVGSPPSSFPVPSAELGILSDQPQCG